MKFRVLVSLSAALLAFASPLAAAGSDEPVRFSKTLTTDEISTFGLAQLSSDQLAILDALVRRDIEKSRLPSRQPRAARFSERLTADERRNAGLAALDATQLAGIDAAVERLISPPAIGAGASPYAGGYSVPNVKLRRDPEIHGSLTLLYGVGSHGYSEYGGGMVLTYDDPADRFSVAVGYSELHTKGGYGYPYLCRNYPYRDPLFRRPGDPFW